MRRYRLKVLTLLSAQQSSQPRASSCLPGEILYSGCSRRLKEEVSEEKKQSLARLDRVVRLEEGSAPAAARGLRSRMGKDYEVVSEKSAGYVTSASRLFHLCRSPNSDIFCSARLLTCPSSAPLDSALDAASLTCCQADDSVYLVAI